MRFSFLLLSLFLFSCSADVPRDVLKPATMEAVLYDVMRADEWVDFASLKDSSYKQFSKRAALYDSVFRLHSISKAQYRKSLSFYQGRPDLLKKILEEMKVKSDTAVRKLNKAATP